MKEMKSKSVDGRDIISLASTLFHLMPMCLSTHLDDEREIDSQEIINITSVFSFDGFPFPKKERENVMRALSKGKEEKSSSHINVFFSF
jgi:hypothetical protein